MFKPDDFEWDLAKSQSNELKHGFGFEFALRVFQDTRLAIYDVSRDADGEERFKAVGFTYGRLMTVVFTFRGRVRRIISVRPSNTQEKRSYGNRSDES